MSITEPRTVDHQVRADAVSAPQPHDGLRPRLSWRRGRVLAGCTLTLAVLLALRSHLPSGPGQLGSLAQTLAPWSGVAVPVLLVLALARRSAPAQIAVVLTALIWGALFGGVLIDKRQQGGGLTVVSHNVDEANRDPEGTARRLAASGADIIALEELRAAAVPAYERVLNRAYGHHSVRGTVGLWSTYPLSDTESVAIMPWTRALRSTVETPKGPSPYTSPTSRRCASTPARASPPAAATRRPASSRTRSTPNAWSGPSWSATSTAAPTTAPWPGSPQGCAPHRRARARGSVSAGRPPSPWCASITSWPEASTRSRPEPFRPPAATTSRSQPPSGSDQAVPSAAGLSCPDDAHRRARKKCPLNCVCAVQGAFMGWSLGDSNS